MVRSHLRALSPGSGADQEERCRIGLELGMFRPFERRELCRDKVRDTRRPGCRWWQDHICVICGSWHLLKPRFSETLWASLRIDAVAAKRFHPVRHNKALTLEECRQLQPWQPNRA